jgi:superfamily II DNA or RNA helicase
MVMGSIVESSCDFRNDLSGWVDRLDSAAHISQSFPIRKAYSAVSTSLVVEHPSDRRQSRPEVPEPGRVVRVRGAIWAVTDVVQQGLPRSPADEGRPGRQHVVTLQSLAEDRLGEELSVVWELEVGHTVVPEQGLPERIDPAGFDDPNQLGAFIDAARWGAVTSADAHTYQAPFRSGANIEPYQLEPLRRALSSPRTNLLLADDVGLGKTIEAGLVIQELLLRHRARSVIIVCPPSLSLKWQDEMRDKFGLEFTIVNSDLMAQVRRSHGPSANPFRLFPRVIVSMAWLPTPPAQRLLRGVLSDAGRPGSARRNAFDVLVVDEAHHVAPAGPSVLSSGRGYAVDSRRTVATRALARRCEHRLFLSATPHNGYSESFTALLEMIDHRRFSRGARLDSAALRQVTVRRLKTELADQDFRHRVIEPLPFHPTPEEEANYGLLDQLLRSTARANGRKGLDIVGLLLRKRFLSSPWAFARTLAAFAQATATGTQLALTDEYYAEVLGSGQADEEEGRQEHPEFLSLWRGKGDSAMAAVPADRIDALIAWGLDFQHRPNTRLDALVDLLDAICRPDGNWQNERVVVFTEYVDTLEWIVDVLRQRGYADVLETIEGSTGIEERELIRARFAEPPQLDRIRVLVATDAAGEGIDLQAHCHRLVNFDIPFNPSRLEQRIGRIDRYGQLHSPKVFYFAPDTRGGLFSGNLAFLRRIGEKVATVEGDLGAVNPLIDAEILDEFTGGSRVAAARAAAADKGAQAINKALAGGLSLNQELTELSRDYRRLRADLHLSPRSTRRVVDAALELTAQPLLVEVGDVDTDAPVFTVPTLGAQWQGAVTGLTTRLRPDVLRPITFDPDAARGRTDLVHVHLGHPLLAKSARILRSALAGVGGTASPINRVTAVVVPDLPVSCVAAVSRLVLVGRGGLRLHEEVVLTGIRFRGRELAEAKAQALIDRALDDPDLGAVDESVRVTLADAWNAADSALRARLTAEVQRRAARRRLDVADALNRRRDDDIERARAIFAAFRVNLAETLQGLESQQAEQEMMLWSDESAAQRRRDIRQMHERLDSLADEEQQEIDGLRERYTDVRAFISTAALVFAVTERDALTLGRAR